MNIFPAIDLYDGCAVRLVKGDYNQMQIYSNDPVSVAKQFEAAGAEYLHVVDLAGAKDGTTPNLETIRAITANTSLKVEVGGGIRSHGCQVRRTDCRRCGYPRRICCHQRVDRGFCPQLPCILSAVK